MNLYEISKLAGEQAVLRVADLLGMPSVSLRLGDVFGRWERTSADRDATSAPFQALELAKRGEKVRLPRSGRKPWIYTVDVARAVRIALTADRLDDRVVNISSQFEWSVSDWCHLLQQEYPGFRHGVEPESPNVALFDDNAPMALENATRMGFTAQYDLPAAFDDYMMWSRSAG